MKNSIIRIMRYGLLVLMVVSALLLMTGSADRKWIALGLAIEIIIFAESEHLHKMAVPIILIAIVAKIIGFLGWDNLTMLLNQTVPLSPPQVKETITIVPEVTPLPLPEITLAPLPEYTKDTYNKTSWRRISGNAELISIGDSFEFSTEDKKIHYWKFQILDPGTVEICLYPKMAHYNPDQEKDTDMWRIVIADAGTLNRSLIRHKSYINRNEDNPSINCDLDRGYYYLIIDCVSGTDPTWAIRIDSSFHVAKQ